jgi:Tol biopolymer transport system component/DNA-binding winged helix-turn-helix (wHTH) protein
MNKKKLHIFEFDNFRLDAGERQLLRDGEPVSLPSKAFDLLVVLVENNGRLVQKEELYRTVWADQVVEESNLTVQMSAIRKALGERKKNPRYIMTVAGYGYRFVGDVASTSDKCEVVIETETVARIVIEREEEDDNGLKTVKAESTFVPRSEMKTISQEDGLSAAGIGTAVGASTTKVLPERGAKSFLQGRSGLFLSGWLIVALLIVGGVLSWRYYSQAKTEDRRAGTASAAILFAESRIRQLTTKGKVAASFLSPDGEFYAYSLAERGKYKNSLWLGQTDGSSEIQLRPPADNPRYWFTFSPDSKMLYFSYHGPEESQNGLFKMPVLGGVAEKLLDESPVYFALSPDATQISFFRPGREKDSSALLIANLDGTGERELLTRPLDKPFASISPAWSPDGSALAVGAIINSATQSQEVFVVSAKDGIAKQLTELDWAEVASLVWLRDGQGLIAVARDKDALSTQLWQIDYPGGNARRLVRDTDRYGSALSVSADGRSLMAVAVRAESNIWIAPADDMSKARQVTFSSINGVYGLSGIDWTPEGRIIFTAGIDNSRALYSMDADGTNIRQLTSAGFVDRRLTVTYDGRFILFESNRSGDYQIWRVQTDGSDLRRLTTDGRNYYPHPTPDGKWVVYVSNRDGNNHMWRMSIEGGESVRVTEKVSSNPRISLDGSLIACDYQADEKAPSQLAIVSIEDGRPVKLFDVPRTANFTNGIRWTPDDKAVCYRDWANGIWRQEINGGPPQRLKGLPEEKIYTYGWSRDGKRFAFTRGREVRDAVLIEDFNQK